MARTIRIFQDSSGSAWNDVRATAIPTSTADAGTVLNAAINEVNAAGGGTVEIGGGTFNFLTRLVPKSYVCIKGAGPGITILRTQTGVVNSLIFALSGDAVTGVIIEDLTVDGNVSVLGTDLDGINLTSAVRPVVRNVEVKNTGGYGIIFNTCTAPTAKDCVVTNVATIQATNPDGITAVNGSRARIEGCTVTDWGNSNNGRGIIVQACADSKILNNDVIQATAALSSNHGIAVSGASHRSKVRGNLVDKTLYSGTARSGAGISVTTATDCSIDDNDVLMPLQNDGSLECILVGTNADRTRIRGNFVNGGDDNGITVWTDECIVTSNEVSNAAHNGIGVGDAAINCTVGENIVKNSGMHGPGSTYAGISVDDGLGIIIKGNRCFDDQGTKTQVYGVRTSGAANFNTIIGNDLRGNLTAPTSLVGANNVVDHNN